MSIMPNANVAEFSAAKILEYLLNAPHPDGAGKAAFFRGMGYRRADWHLLTDALAEVAATGVVRAVATTER
jgi:hypothetical protein